MSAANDEQAVEVAGLAPLAPLLAVSDGFLLDISSAVDKVDKAGGLAPRLGAAARDHLAGA